MEVIFFVNSVSINRPLVTCIGLLLRANMTQGYLTVGTHMILGVHYLEDMTNEQKINNADFKS